MMLATMSLRMGHPSRLVFASSPNEIHRRRRIHRARGSHRGLGALLRGRASPGAACSAEAFAQRRSLRAAPTVTRFPHTSGHTTGADPPVEDDERRELVMRELALVVLILVALAVAAGRYGVDSREGFEWSARGRL